MRALLLALMLLATLAQMLIMQRRFQRDMEITATRESVKRLAAATMQVFRGEDPPTGLAFWKAIGRTDPVFDLWGQEFRMEIFVGETHKEYIWSSAGPDRLFGTSDDIRARVPYQKGATLDLTRPEISHDLGPTSNDAK